MSEVDNAFNEIATVIKDSGLDTFDKNKSIILNRINEIEKSQQESEARQREIQDSFDELRKFESDIQKYVNSGEKSEEFSEVVEIIGEIDTIRLGVKFEGADDRLKFAVNSALHSIHEGQKSFSFNQEPRSLLRCYQEAMKGIEAVMRDIGMQ